MAKWYWIGSQVALSRYSKISWLIILLLCLAFIISHSPIAVYAILVGTVNLIIANIHDHWQYKKSHSRQQSSKQISANRKPNKAWLKKLSHRKR